jgi:hypothetical protein
MSHPSLHVSGLLIYNSLCSCPSPSVSAITIFAASAASASLLLIASFTPAEASEAIEVAVSDAADEAELAAFSTILSGFGTPEIPTSSVSKTRS